MELLNKSAVVAEIKKLIDEIYAGRSFNSLSSEQQTALWYIKSIMSSINTLEVKEVDLNKETTHYLVHEHSSPLIEIMHKADIKAEMQYHKDIENAFKSGFELGIKVVQKGE